MAYQDCAMTAGLYLMLQLCWARPCTAVAVLDNVTPWSIRPLITHCARAEIPIHLLAGGRCSSDTGRHLRRCVGDPPNIMIGSAADISFNNFVIHMGPITLVSWLAGWFC